MNDRKPDVSGEDRAPLVTVALPVYNGGAYLRPAVMSIVNQSFGDWELLIIDDGSSDDAIERIKNIKDERIRVIQDGLNKGIAARLNEAIDLARGRYLARMDSDDISYPERFLQQVEMLETDPGLDLVGVRAVAISQQDQLIGHFPHALSHEDICRHPWRGFYLPHPTWMGRTEWFRRHRYAFPAPYFCEDQELLLRSFETSRFAVIDEVLFAYRVRNLVAWRKSFKTRRTWLGVQVRHFVRTKRWGYALLAVLAFVARVAMDCLDALVQTARGKARVRHREEMGAGAIAKWNAVKTSVSRH